MDCGELGHLEQRNVSAGSLVPKIKRKLSHNLILVDRCALCPGYGAYPEDLRLSCGVKSFPLGNFDRTVTLCDSVKDSLCAFQGHARLCLSSLALADVLGSLAMRQCVPPAQCSHPFPSSTVLRTT
jgi:hypothetical protein